MNIYPVILCGGSGTRLWPLSRRDAPKQFVHLFGEDEPTLFESTVARLRVEDGFQRPVIVSREDYRFRVLEGLENADVVPEVVLLEPSARNTAAAIAAAAAVLSRMDPTAVMAVMPSDHIVRDIGGLAQTVRTAAVAAAAGRIVLIGIRPSEPHTGYGYVKPGAVLPCSCAAREVVEFVEKPKLELARQFLASGEHLWNGGFFIMQASVYLQELARLEPATHEGALAAVRDAREDLGFYRLERAAFERCPPVSIDCAIMGRTPLAAVVEAELGWSDVGSWSSIAGAGAPDKDGNVVMGDVLLAATVNSLVHTDDRLVATLGLDNVMVISSGDALLVADRSCAQDVGGVVALLKQRQRPEAYVHLRQHRPWGFFKSLANGNRFQVKVLHVKPGGKLSLQMHHHRSEHWVVVRGTARITVGTEPRYLREGESAYIGATEWHRLENPGTEPLDVIEVQIGSYLGEDDIVRGSDVYNRQSSEKPAPFAAARGASRKPSGETATAARHSAP